MTDLDVIRAREETAEWFAGREPEPDEHARESYPVAARRQRLRETLPTVRREAEDEYGHRLQPGVSFTAIGRGGVGEWIICKRCGGDISVAVADNLDVQVEGCNIEPCPASTC